MKKLMLITALVCGVAAFGAITPHPNDGKIDVSQVNDSNAITYRDVRVWPTTATNVWTALNLDTRYPATCGVLKKYIPNSSKLFWEAWADMVKEEATLDELLGMLGEEMDNNTFARNNAHCEMVVNSIMNKGFTAVRKYLKKQGKSFVTKDGVNPCEPYMKGLTDAMNAPRFAGLEKWFADMGVTVTIDLKYMPTDAVIKAQWKKIVDGDVEISDYWRDMIRYGLGLEEYNKFVKEYNGEQ